MDEVERFLDKEATIKLIFDMCHTYKIKNKDLAELFNVSEVVISMWANGKRFPDWERIVILKYIFDVEIDDLIVRKHFDIDDRFDEIINQIRATDLKHLEESVNRKFKKKES